MLRKDCETGKTLERGSEMWEETVFLLLYHIVWVFASLSLLSSDDGSWRLGGHSF